MRAPTRYELRRALGTLKRLGATRQGELFRNEEESLDDTRVTLARLTAEHPDIVTPRQGAPARRCAECVGVLDSIALRDGLTLCVFCTPESEKVS